MRPGGCLTGGSLYILYIGVQLDAARLGASPPWPPRRGGTHVDEIHACLSPLGRLAEGG